jgi:catechol 1,2-dioxygenase
MASLVDEITYKKAAEAADTITQSAILGPFFRHDAPKREKNASITFDTPKDGQVVYMHGQVLNAKDMKPLPNASVDIWQASTNGMINPSRPSLRLTLL